MKPQQGQPHEGIRAFCALAQTVSPLSCGICNKGLVWGVPQEPARRACLLKSSAEHRMHETLRGKTCIAKEGKHETLRGKT